MPDTNPEAVDFHARWMSDLTHSDAADAVATMCALEAERDEARSHVDDFIAAARKLTCGPANMPTTKAEHEAVKLEKKLRGYGFSARPMAALWTAWADDVKPLHDLVKAHDACTCAGEDAAQAAPSGEGSGS